MKSAASKFIQPKIVRRQTFPAKKELGSDTIVIYDQNIIKSCPNFSKWIKNFPCTYSVRGGEKLKDIYELPKHLNKILNLSDKLSLSKLTLIVVGGGSVGDFGGFIASVLKRGVRLVHIPSTWLSAIDSAHGGKTALNVGHSKNQIGTFYSAEKIYFIKELLDSQPIDLAQDALSELYKMALIDSALWGSQLFLSKKPAPDLIWNFLGAAVQAKYKIVKKDPYEKVGPRRLLNLGHSFGHIVEAHMGWSHGRSVALGLLFAIEWSFHKKYLSKNVHWLKILHERLFYSFNINLKHKIKSGLKYQDDQFKPLSSSEFMRLALRDKKKTNSNQFIFIFIKKQGQCIQKEVSVQEFLKEAKRQGYVR